MIYSVTVINYLNERLKMELTKPAESGFAIYNITGIGNVKADINLTELATADGALFNSSRLDKRNIVISAKLEWVPTIEESRHTAYKFFPTGKAVTLIFETDTRTCAIDGYVETNDPNIFQEQEEVQISVICPNPFFRSVNSKRILFYGVDPLFEFPFSNESLTEPLIEFGKIKRYTDQNIVYDGDAETGVIISMHAIGKVENISIYKVQTREKIVINTSKIETLTGAGLNRGDEIIISTLRSGPYARLLRGGKYINILNAIGRDADWFQLTKGDNVFAYTAEYGVGNLEFEMEYNTLYGGV